MKILETAKYLGTNAYSCDANGIWISLTQYSETNLPDYSLHAHVNSHLTLMLQGGTLEKRQKEEFQRLPGEVVFFHSGEPHQNSHSINKTKNINLEFEPTFLKTNGLEENDICQTVEKKPDAKFLLLKAYHELLVKDNFSSDSINMIVLDLVKSPPQVQKENIRPMWVNILHEMLQDRWNEQVTLQELSFAANVHPITISKHFPKYFSCTLGEYMRKLKIEKALTLLKSTSSDLTAIALTCGFADQSHFIRTFKQITGFLPHQFKKL
jgi:AraC family transcriptional regulator